VANRVFNAKNQVTLWGPSGQINDYAAKHWSGLVKSYYGQRWSNWTSYILDVMAKGETYDETQAHDNAIAIGQAWDASSELFPDETSGALAIDVLKSLNETYLAASAEVKSQFTAMPNVDYPGNDLFQSGTKDVDQLMLLCNSMPACAGFNVPGGYVKFEATASQPVSDTTFYKRTMPQN
jgi:alpha-N-acetylglucosaminidase